MAAAVENGPELGRFAAKQQSIAMQFLKYLASTLRTGFRTLIPTCRQVSRLQSEALDRDLSRPNRFGLRFHLLVCKWCRRYGKQVRFLRRATHEHSEELTDATPHALPAEARQRLNQSLRNKAK